MTAIVEGKVRAAEREQQARAWLAWHAAALGRSKRFPRLQELMPKPPVPRRQTEAEMIANMKAIFASRQARG